MENICQLWILNRGYLNHCVRGRCHARPQFKAGRCFSTFLWCYRLTFFLFFSPWSSFLPFFPFFFFPFGCDDDYVLATLLSFIFHLGNLPPPLSAPPPPLHFYIYLSLSVSLFLPLSVSPSLSTNHQNKTGTHTLSLSLLIIRTKPAHFNEKRFNNYTLTR